MVKLSYDVVGQISFFTVGEDEVRAWEIKHDTVAQKAAGKIHTDLARGFIKAELISHEELMTAHSFQDARSKGLTKLVDADFSVPEKTVLEIRFNV